MEKPSWVIEKDYNNKDGKNNGNNGNKNENNNKNKRYKVDKEPSQEINFEKDSRLNIPDSSVKYGEVFTADIRKEFGKVIRNDKGKIICHKFHIKGICDTNCKLKASHVPISKENIKSLLEFSEFAFSKHDKLKELVRNRKVNENQG